MPSKAGKQLATYDDGQSDDPSREAAYLAGVRQAIVDFDPDNDNLGESKRQQAKIQADVYCVDHGELSSELQQAVDYARGYQHATTFMMRDWEEGAGVDERGFRERWQRWGKRLKPFAGIDWNPSTDSPTLSDCISQAVGLGGFLAEYIEFNLRTAYRKQPAFALAGGLALVATLSGRKVRDSMNTRNNVYFVCVATPGVGKDHARRCNEEILASAGGGHLLAPEEMTSDSAMARTLVEHPCRLFQPDEVGRWLATADPKHSPHHFSLVSLLLKLFSSVTSTAFQPKAYADTKYNLTIDQPHLVMLATSTPESLYAALGAASVLDGLMSRLAVIEGNSQAKRHKPAGSSSKVPKSILEFARYWVNFKPGGNLATEHPAPVVVAADPEAEKEFDYFGDWCDMQAGGKSSVQSLWRRAELKARQYALCMAVSRAPVGTPPHIDIATACWAIDLSRVLTGQVVDIVRTRIASSAFESMCQDHLRFIKDHGPCSLSTIARGLRRYSSRERVAAIEQLQAEQAIEIVTSGREHIVQVSGIKP